MPNLWTKTSQKISEAFSGPRTKDTEFDGKVEEIKIIEKGVLSFKNFLQNMINSTQSLKIFAKEMSTCIKTLYEKNSPYAIFANEINEAHTEMEKLYNTFSSKIISIQSQANDWGILFNDVKSQILKREDLRKKYDHYDEKLEKLYKTRQERLKKNITESNKETELLRRVY